MARTCLVKNNRDDTLTGDMVFQGDVLFGNHAGVSVPTFDTEVTFGVASKLVIEGKFCPDLDNTASLSGTAAKMMPVYDSEGDLVGYVNVYPLA